MWGGVWGDLRSFWLLRGGFDGVVALPGAGRLGWQRAWMELRMGCGKSALILATRVIPAQNYPFSHPSPPLPSLNNPLFPASWAGGWSIGSGCLSQEGPDGYGAIPGALAAGFPPVLLRKD